MLSRKTVLRNNLDASILQNTRAGELDIELWVGVQGTEPQSMPIESRGITSNTVSKKTHATDAHTLQCVSIATVTGVLQNFCTDLEKPSRIPNSSPLLRQSSSEGKAFCSGFITIRVVITSLKVVTAATHVQNEELLVATSNGVVRECSPSAVAQRSEHTVANIDQEELAKMKASLYASSLSHGTDMQPFTGSTSRRTEGECCPQGRDTPSRLPGHGTSPS